MQETTGWESLKYGVASIMYSNRYDETAASICLKIYD